MFRDFETADLQSLLERAQNGQSPRLEVLAGIAVEYLRIKIAQELAERAPENDGDPAPIPKGRRGGPAQRGDAT